MRGRAIPFDARRRDARDADLTQAIHPTPHDRDAARDPILTKPKRS
jgi:hypothetical protein